MEVPRVRCRMGDGDKPLDPITHPLIITRSEAKKRGFAELYETYWIKYRISLQWPFRDGDENIRRGSYIVLKLPEFGFRRKTVWVREITFDGEEDVIVSATVEWYEPMEKGISVTTILIIDGGTATLIYTNIIDGGTASIEYTDIYDGGSA